MSLSSSVAARFSLGLAAGFMFTGLALVSGGCGESNPLQSACDRHAECADTNGWQFSQTECEQEAQFQFEKVKSALCVGALEAYATCVDSLALACDDDEATEIAKECKSETEDLTECMQDAAEDEANERSGSSGKSSSSGGKSSGGTSSSSGGTSSSGGASGGGLDAYCDMVSECAGGNVSAEACASQQDAMQSAAERAGCGDELDELFGCAAKLSCSDLAQYTSKCKSQYDAYTACGTGG